MRGVRTGACVAFAASMTGLVVCASGTAQAAGQAGARHATSPWHVTIKADRKTLTLGQKVRFTGKVSKAAGGGLVRLYERGAAGKPWRYQRNALVHKDGHYATYDKPTVNSARQYRVVMAGDEHHRRGVSGNVTVDVFRWTSLSGFPEVNSSNLDIVSSVSIDGVSLPQSLEARIYHLPDSSTTQSTEFNLGRRCTGFRGTFGLSDDSETGSRATVTAQADGTAWFTQTFGLGESAPDTQAFATAPLKLRFQTTSEVDGADGLGAVGTPEVYCER
jgi:hypothetical protein